MRRIPLATYRLQFNKDFRFADACGILGYLHDFGVTDIYASPILASRRGSSHGYDATDPTRIDPDLGTDADFAHFQRELEAHGMGLVLDVVPNHMAASNENPWWVDVLENGAASPFASYFDIDWHPPSRTLNNRILLPVLGKPFGEVLDSDEIQLVRQDERFYIRYYELLFPLAAHSYRRVLSERPAVTAESDGWATNLRELVDSPAACNEFEGIVVGLSSLFDAAVGGPAARTSAERRLQFNALHERLRQLLQSEPRIGAFLDDSVRGFNGTPGKAESFSALERLLGQQHYKLAFWQSTTETINYRRFFTITDLVGVHIEDPLVFEAAHGYLLRAFGGTAFTGFRIDHIDGLRDPLGYLTKLQERLAAQAGDGIANSAFGNGRAASGPAFLLVEKILGHEQLPTEWPVNGTTGYDYLNFANGLFVNEKNGPGLERAYCSFIGRSADWPDVLYQKKKQVMGSLLNPEMQALGRALSELAAEDRYAREIPPTELTEALIETTGALPVYRTYIRNLEIPESAREIIASAIAAARERRPQLNPRAFDFVSDVLLLANPPHVFPEQREGRLNFVMRWQQVTGPIVAKGLEDTALYVYLPLASLNEVGGDPRPSETASANDFHAYIQKRSAHWPHAMNASTTHDTKRSEDARMRINALADVPDEWATGVREWAEENARFKSHVDGQLVPDRNEEYLLYQTLLGICPACPPHGDEREQLVRRLQDYVVKATREAMVHTRWTRPNEDHENALVQFVARVLDPSNGAFRQSFTAFHREIARVAAKNSLAQTMLKIAAPGIPDFYQGAELWDLRLVDPDNRTRVDFAKRVELLASLCANFERPSRAQLCSLVSNWRDGRVKLYVIWKTLQVRARARDLFESGDYLPLDLAGPRSEEVLAFARRNADVWAIGVIPRWRAFDPTGATEHGGRLGTDWRETKITLPRAAPSEWESVLTREKVHSRAGEITVADALSVFPTALLFSNRQF